MSKDSNELSPEVLKEKYEDILFKVVSMRRTYPGSNASLLSNALHMDADMMMKAEIVPDEQFKDVYLPRYTDKTKVESLGLHNRLEPFVNQANKISRQILDIRDVLNQIRAARHKNVLE